ncbi:MAG: hypothetical protein DI534_15400 [Leifsonia xyli]|nr:MAG: hypothetical protein DI534_15400 [Leifsonia xyli]
MTRFTDNLRKSAGVRDGDPVAPVFDAIDDLDGRVVCAEAQFGHAAATEKRVRRDLTRKAIVAGFLMAVTSTGLAMALMSSLIAGIERRSADEVRRLDEERARSLDARVEKRAAEIAFKAVTDANGRATSAEAQLEIARDKLASLARNADDEVRDLVKSIATAPREDLFLMAKLLRHQNPNVRKACDALTAVSPALITKLQAYFAANKGRL